MKRDLISMDDLSAGDIREYLELAEQVERIPHADKGSRLLGRILMVMFFEPSTRTRLSFESAMCRLGGSVIGFSESMITSVAKGESVVDTIHTVENYADIIVIRHPKEGTARLASEISYLPVINAGDGTNQHPSQTLLDLYTIKKFFGKIHGLRIAFIGDLKYSRTVHSLIQALLKFPRQNFLLVSPETLRLPEYLMRDDEDAAIFSETTGIEEALSTCDLIYMTRIQKERFPDLVEYEKVKDSYCIDTGMLEHAPDSLRILHPLPRVNEISYSVDRTTYAGYFQQVRNGLFMRQAILLKLLGESI